MGCQVRWFSLPREVVVKKPCKGMNLQGLSQHNQATFPRLSEGLAGGAAFFSPLMRICGGLWLRPLRFTLLRNMSLRRKKRPFGWKRHAGACGFCRCASRCFAT